MLLWSRRTPYNTIIEIYCRRVDLSVLKQLGQATEVVLKHGYCQWLARSTRTTKDYSFLLNKFRDIIRFIDLINTIHTEFYITTLLTPTITKGLRQGQGPIEECDIIRFTSCIKKKETVSVGYKRVAHIIHTWRCVEVACIFVAYRVYRLASYYTPFSHSSVCL